MDFARAQLPAKEGQGAAKSPPAGESVTAGSPHAEKAGIQKGNTPPPPRKGGVFQGNRQREGG